MQQIIREENYRVHALVLTSHVHVTVALLLVHDEFVIFMWNELYSRTISTVPYDIIFHSERFYLFVYFVFARFAESECCCHQLLLTLGWHTTWLDRFSTDTNADAAVNLADAPMHRCVALTTRPSRPDMECRGEIEHIRREISSAISISFLLNSIWFMFRCCWNSRPCSLSLSLPFWVCYQLAGAWHIFIWHFPCKRLDCRNLLSLFEVCRVMENIAGISLPIPHASSQLHVGRRWHYEHVHCNLSQFYRIPKIAITMADCCRKQQVINCNSNFPRVVCVCGAARCWLEPSYKSEMQFWAGHHIVGGG